MVRRWMLVLGFVLFMTAVAYAESPSPIKYGVEEKVIIPGTWSYDVDSMSLPYGPERFLPWIKNLGIKMSFDYTKVKYGAKEGECDIFWRHINKTQRKLVPQNGAELARLGKVNFKATTLKDLTSAKYSKDGIVADNNNNQLTPGTVVGIRTNKGNYAKMRVDKYLPLIIPKNTAESTQNYHLQCTLVVYPQSIWAGESEEIKSLLKTDINSAENSGMQKDLVKKGGAIVEILISVLPDKNLNVRYNAANCLGQIRDKRAVRPLITTLRDTDERVRVSAAIALGIIGDKEAVEPLITLLKDEKGSVRVNCAYALAMVGDARAVDPILVALRNELKLKKGFGSPLGMATALSMIKNGIRDIKQKGDFDKLNADSAMFGSDPDKWQKWWNENRRKVFKGRAD